MDYIQTSQKTNHSMDKNLMNKAKILVVDDEAIMARDLQLSLESMGFEVPYIESAGEGAFKRAFVFIGE